MYWWDEAACRGHDPGLFDIGMIWQTGPASDVGRAISAAKICCAACPVKRPCLAAAFREERTMEPYGIRGGTTPRERWPDIPPPEPRIGQRRRTS